MEVEEAPFPDPEHLDTFQFPKSPTHPQTPEAGSLGLPRGRRLNTRFHAGHRARVNKPRSLTFTLGAGKIGFSNTTVMTAFRRCLSKQGQRTPTGACVVLRLREDLPTQRL